MKALKTGRDWTPADVRRMKKSAKAGESARIAADRLRRTRGAVAYKAMVEGVHFRSIKQPPGVQKKRFARSRRRRT